MNIWWLVGAALFGVAALSVYGAFQSPEFVMGLFGAMLVAGYKAIEPVLAKRMTPEDEAAWRAAEQAVEITCNFELIATAAVQLTQIIKVHVLGALQLPRLQALSSDRVLDAGELVERDVVRRCGLVGHHLAPQILR